MKAIEVLNMLVAINYDFFKSLNEYLEQEDATALLVINKSDYTRSVYLYSDATKAHLDKMKATQQKVQVYKVEADMFTKITDSLYNTNWSDVEEEYNKQLQLAELEKKQQELVYNEPVCECNSTGTINTNVSRQGSYKVEINPSTGIISIHSDIF